jgi:hypothetical protein
MALTSPKAPPATGISPEFIQLRQGVTLLIEGVSLQAPSLDPEAGERFQRKMFECQRLTREARQIDQILPILGALGSSLSDCVTDARTRAEEIRRRHIAIVALLNEELTRHGIPPKLQESLRQLEAEIKCANTAADLELVRVHLDSAIHRAAAGFGAVDEHDDAIWKWDVSESPTGFRGPSQATQFLDVIFGTDPQYYVVLIRLPLLQAIEQLYGAETSGEYLNSAAQYLVEKSESTDHLFHWRHDVLMRVTKQDMSPGGFRQRMARIAGARHDELIEVNQRRIVVANTMSFELYPLMRYANLGSLLDAFEPFVSGKPD